MKKFISTKEKGISAFFKKCEQKKMEMHSAVIFSRKVRKMKRLIDNPKDVSKEELIDYFQKNIKEFSTVWQQISDEQQNEYKEVLLNSLNKTKREFLDVTTEEIYLNDNADWLKMWIRFKFSNSK